MAKEYPHAGHRKRLRERFLQDGADALSETELIELLLFFSVPRVDTKPLAEKLLESFGSVDGVLAASPEDMHALAGCSENTDALFSLVRYLCERMTRQTRKSQFCSPEFVRTYLPTQFAGYKNERAILFYLDADGSLLHRQTVISSETDMVQFPQRAVLETAQRVGACSLLIAHNHPNGKLRPSKADLRTTKEFFRVCRDAGLQLLDHYIVAGEDCAPILACNEWLKLE